jgi:serine/threonine protein kinase
MENITLDKRYRILKRLKSGGFGETFIAEDTQIPSMRRCLVKKLHPVNDNNSYRLIRDRFDREAAILEDLGSGSDQIPTLYAYFEEDSNFFLVQELIEGNTLSTLLTESEKFSEAYVRSFLTSFLEVIDYVHSKGIIHRDINPNNIIIRNCDNKPVLIDFGAVKESMGTIISSSGNITQSIVIGTPGFMPSEQAAGRPVYSSDLYAVGLTAIYMLTGELPEMIGTDPRTGKILWKQYAPRITPTLASILDKSISPYANERYRAASDMIQALLPRTSQPGQKKTDTVVVSHRNDRTQTGSSVPPSKLGCLQKALIVSGLLAISISGLLAISIFLGLWPIKLNPPDPAPFPTFTPTPQPSPISDKKILGIWYLENRCPTSDGTIESKGTIEFFRNNSFTHVGEVILSGSKNGDDFSMTWETSFTGEWNLDDDILVSKLVDLKSQLIHLTVNNEKIDVSQIDQRKIDLPRLENFIPKGSSEEETILELSDSKMVSKTKSSSCQTISEYSKRNRTFR